LALALATALGQLMAGVCWFAIIAVALALSPGARGAIVHGPARAGWFGGVAVLLWLMAVGAEALVAFGVGRFIGRVRPDLLPQAPGPVPAVALGGSGA
jgi:hypothetical protein